MSLSNSVELKNPAVKQFEWSGDNGGFRWYNKETKERIDIDLPFTFLVLDTLSTVRGYSDSDTSGYYSNEVRDLKKEPFTVRTKQGVKATGLYADLFYQCPGMKYTQSVYIAYYEGEELVIGNLQLKGAAVSAWIEYRKKNKIYKVAIDVSESVQGKKGKTIFQIPVFHSTPASEETINDAIELDKTLQEYLTAYLSRTPHESKVVQEEAAAVNSNESQTEVEDDLPF